MPFITFEGIDGSGKSTQVRLLCERMREAGVEPIVLREPGGTPLSESVRELLLDTRLHVEPLAELLLFSAARSQLSFERIRPLLEAGRVVVCDRFYDSTVAYQGGGRQIVPFDWLTEFNALVTGGLIPDRTYYLRVSVEEAGGRRRRTTDDRLESGGKEFFSRVVETYDRIADEHPERVLVIDGRKPVRDIAERVWEDAAALIGR